MMIRIHFICMSLSKELLKQISHHYPAFQPVAQQIHKRSNLIVNYPLALLSASNRHCIVPQAPVPANHDLLLLSAEECLFSSGFSGAGPGQESHLDAQLGSIASRYEFMSEEFANRVKMYIQIIANTQRVALGASMPLQKYCEYVLASPTWVLPEKEVNSRFLKELNSSLNISSRLTYGYLSKEILKRCEEEDYLLAVEKSRPFMREAGQTKMKYMAPVLDRLEHSFAPNCQFDLLYFPHRRSPFIRIQTLRALKEGERATINYGRLNNYQLLIRYGFTVKDNPHSIFMLPLQYEQIMEIFNKNVEWKQKQFIKQNITLKNYIRIEADGSISQADMKALRILCNQSNSPKEDSTEHDSLIYQFVGQQAQFMRQHLKLDPSKQSSDNKHVRAIEEEQERILESYLHRHL